MTTYSVRCKHTACRHRRVTRTHPFDYKVVPRCPVCGRRKGWRIEQRDYNKRGLCQCDGPMGRNGEPFPHRTTHPCCEQHPHGIYNQARARGVAHEDIPKEYHPVPKDDQKMTRWDNFAAAALSGATGHPESGCNTPRDLAHWAAQCADALMRERARRMDNLITECPPCAHFAKREP